MYNDAPSGEVTLEDFEVTALDRLKGALCFGGGCCVWQ